MYPWSVGALCPVQSLQIPASMRARIRTASPSAGGHGHETVVKPNRVLSRRYPVNHLAVRPVSIANRDRLQRPASRHHGRSAEARGKAGSIARGDTHRGTPPGIESSSSAVVVRSGVIVIRSHAVGCARSGHAEDCQAGGTRQQLQRWLRNELQIRQGPLGRMQRVDGRVCDCAVLGHVPRYAHLPKLRGLRGDQMVPGLGPAQSPVAL